MSNVFFNKCLCDVVAVVMMVVEIMVRIVMVMVRIMVVMMVIVVGDDGEDRDGGSDGGKGYSTDADSDRDNNSSMPTPQIRRKLSKALAPITSIKLHFVLPPVGLTPETPPFVYAALFFLRETGNPGEW